MKNHKYHVLDSHYGKIVYTGNHKGCTEFVALNGWKGYTIERISKLPDESYKPTLCVLFFAGYWVLAKMLAYYFNLDSEALCKSPGYFLLYIGGIFFLWRWICYKLDGDQPDSVQEASERDNDFNDFNDFQEF